MSSPNSGLDLNLIVGADCAIFTSDIEPNSLRPKTLFVVAVSSIIAFATQDGSRDKWSSSLRKPNRVTQRLFLVF